MIQQPAGGVPQAQQPQQQQAAPPFMKGQQAQQAMQQEQAKADMRSNGTFRFYVKYGEERMITFLDGNLDANGMLDIPFINEHRVRIQGDLQTIACTEPNETCPLCEAAQQNNSQDFGFAAFTGLLTVIDHTGYVDKQGVHHQNVVRLYPAKRKQIEMLTKFAQHNGSLAGMCFNVSRSSDKSAAVGDIMVPQGQYNPQDLINHYKAQDPQSKVGVLDYNKEVTYFDANTLRGMLGMGGGAPMGGAPQQQPQPMQYNHQSGAVPQQAPQQQAPAQQPIAGQVPQQQAPMQQAPMQQAPQQQQPAMMQQDHSAAPPPNQPVQQPAAPAPVLQMIATDYTYDQYITAGWNDEKLVQHGKAQWVEPAPAQQQAAPPPMQQAPQQAPQQDHGAPFQPHDPNTPDVNTDYSGQL